MQIADLKAQSNTGHLSLHTENWLLYITSIHVYAYSSLGYKEPSQNRYKQLSNQLTTLSNNQPINQHMYQSTNQWMNQSINIFINQSTND